MSGVIEAVTWKESADELHARYKAERDVEARKRLQPMDETVHTSARPARAALEVSQGFFEEHGVEVGDRVTLTER